MMTKTLTALTIFSCSLITFAGAVAGPILVQPGTTYEVAPPVYETTPLPPGARHESMYFPEPQEYQTVVPYVESAPYSPALPPLYDRVDYRDQHRKHPHAVPYLVEVPLWKPILPRRRANYCGPECAMIIICVPPCDVPRVRVTRFGHKLRYDFGKYEVDVVVRRDGRIIVDYDA
ncbi:hypothetical protein [uncultured Rubinisphaera sp.]|uniref:hypothetical protein n=1 Tax=uncultured Rubinisphaera sp. TaxID=1678686 RepID=UPI0030D90CA0